MSEKAYRKDKKYCGSGFIINHFEKKFNRACYDHDVDYDDGKLDRKAADLKFLNNLLLVSNSRFDGFRAYMYYYLVRRFAYFRYKKKRYE